MPNPETDDWKARLAGAPDLADDMAAARARDYKLQGRLYRFGAELAALRSGGPGAPYLFVRISDVSDCADAGGGEVTLSLDGDAPCYIAEAQTVQGLVDLLARRRMQAAPAAADGPQGAAPFILATPHHAGAAWYPSQLGGPIPLTPDGGRGDFVSRGGTSLLKDERITLPEGGVGPQSEDDPDPVVPPEGTMPSRDSLTFSDILSAPPGAPFGPFAPQGLKPLLDMPPQPFGPFLPQGPGNIPKPPASDFGPGLGPFTPPQQATSWFSETNTAIDSILSKVSGGFTPPRADFTFDF